MIFHESNINPMHDIILLIPKEWDILTNELLEKFELLLVAAGFVPEIEDEVIKSFWVLKDLGIIESKVEKDKILIKRKIQYGE